MALKIRTQPTFNRHVILLCQSASREKRDIGYLDIWISSALSALRLWSLLLLAFSLNGTTTDADVHLHGRFVSSGILQS